MKKIIALVLTIVMLMGVASCGKTERIREERNRESRGTTSSGVDIEELKTIEGPM